MSCCQVPNNWTTKLKHIAAKLHMVIKYARLGALITYNDRISVHYIALRGDGV